MASKSTFTLFALVAVVRAHQLSEPTQSPPSAEVYVINIAERVDKCHCMQQQLVGSPWPVYRFEAVDQEWVYEYCPTMVQPNMDVRYLKTMALVCSNKMIWEQFLKNSTSEHVVIFEDDAAILDDSVWSQLSDFFATPCIEWDYLMFDPFGTGQGQDQGCQNFRLETFGEGLWGSHMQVFHRRALEKLITYVENHRPAGMDKLVNKVAAEDPTLKAFIARANFVTQGRMWGRYTDKPYPCESSVATRGDRRSESLQSMDIEAKPFDC